MVPLIVNKLNALRHICRTRRVACLEVFGSAASADSDPWTRDLDFLVEFLPLEPGHHADAYFGLLADLEDLFERPIDLVMVRAIRNPYFLESINRTREQLYAA